MTSRPAPATGDGLRPLGTLWRLAAVLLCVTVLVGANLRLTNDPFPFGVLEQYAKGIDPNGEVREACLLGVTASRPLPFEIPFGRQVGTERADVERRLRAGGTGPEQLAPLAAAYARAHPEDPLTRLELCEEVTTLHDGAPAGPPQRVTVAVWEAP
ncbi:hypothetical protein JSY14_01725 [Brachybacterium sp. EF45031]|uniref:hypothetical protein n=1 Tax=Brachybacterium sillae TaxID=2810536 RepID=UPI00217CDA89|nr:hypothetical protein [Brachybacterium sillae]MCS6710801.1 hypothetical protein [Brachybacterium sillae]